MPPLQSPKRSMTVSKADEQRARIRGKVAASQDRLRRESEELPALPQRQHFPDAYPPEDYRSLAAEYPWLTVAAGVGAGMLVGALLPKGAGGKLGKRALTVATLAAEFGMAMSRKAGDKASESGSEGLRRIGEATAPLRQRASRGGSAARSAGMTLAREAIKIAARRSAK